MGMINSALKSSSPAALSLLRLVAAYLFLQHGTAKLFHVPHLPIFDQLLVLSRDGFAGMLEIVGSPLMLLPMNRISDRQGRSYRAL